MDLSKSGWRIHPDWLEKSPAKSAKELLKSALDTDIKDLKSEEQILSRLLESAQKEKIFKCPSGGGIVLQINKIRNVSAPKINEDSSVAPRMIKLTLSDGHNSVQAVEMQPKIDKLNTSTAPGNKIRLKTDAEIPFVGGFLQLRNEHCEILGGRVETLAEKFEVQKKLQKFTRATDSHAPPWIPFGKKIVAANVDAKQVSKTLKSNSASASNEDAKGEEDKSEFKSARQDAIDEASKSGGKKVFGGGKAEIKEGGGRKRNDNKRRDKNSEESSNATGANSAEAANGERGAERGGRGGGRRGRGRNNRTNDDDDDHHHQAAKPSSGIQLFDYLEKDFPAPQEAEKSHNNNKGNYPHNHSNNSRGQQQQPLQTHHGDQQRGQRRGGGQGQGGGRGRGQGQDRRRQQQQHQMEEPHVNSSHQHAQGGRFNHNNNGRDNNNTNRRNIQQHSRPNRHQSDRDFGEWSNSTYHEQQQKQQQQEQRHHHQRQQQPLLDDFRDMKLDSGDQNRRQQQQQRRPPRHQQQQQQPHQPQKQHQQVPRHQPAPPSAAPFKWNTGSHCLAKYWEDGKFYPSIVKATTQTTAVVLFTEYGNHEEVLLSDLIQVGGGSGKHHQKSPQEFIPVTPGLPPAFPQ